jgi:hypothetical protein
MQLKMKEFLNGILTDEGGSDGDKAIVNNWTTQTDCLCRSY